MATPLDLIAQSERLTVLEADNARLREALREAEAALRASEERYQLILGVSEFVGTWDWDILNDRLLANERVAEFFGLDAAQVASGVPLSSYVAGIHPEDRERVWEAVSRTVDSAGVFAEEYRLLGRDGSVRWVFAHGRCARDERGRSTRFPGVMFDITGRRRSEEALREQEAYHLVEVDLTPQISWTADAEGRVDRVPARWLEVTGHPSEDALGDDWLRLAHPEDRAATSAAWARAVTSGNTYDAEYRMRVADGRYRWMHSRALPRRDAQGRILGWHGITQDVHDRRSAVDALRELNETLESRVAERTHELAAANERLQAEMGERERAEAALRQAQKMEAVGQLTGGIAHDFNNLLSGIMGSLSLLEKRLELGQVDQAGRYIRAATSSVNRAAALTHRLLAFSRRQPLEPRPVDAHKLIMSLEELIRRTLGPSIQLEVPAGESLWPTLCDPNQLENALLNLVINARDAMPSGGRLRLETVNMHLGPDDVAAQRDELPGDYVCIRVSDTGSGMTPDVIARAFEPFFTTKPLGQGTGLGLSMIYGFVKQSEGHVRIDSRVGEGTSVALFLPRFEGAVGEVGTAVGAAETPRAEGETVLVVEDEALLRELVVEILGELGYRTIEAEDGPAGLKVVQSKKQRIDLLVTDIGLPGLNGRQLADAARESRPGLKVLFMTGYAENAVFGNGLDSGMQMITKPFNPDALASRVREMFEA
ncbi:hybrid sensor histidine kinase/response regulator [Melittangium boletus]|uniref:hybrid sensor histidine kinase/response regulator n=1 Tax=Melittangium boletus TaxID=83453 RepID=UPI001FE89DB0|nr:PAS domain-containing sensor histidine kinase [Melittangium boletus]